jgi:hypothetical protein
MPASKVMEEFRKRRLHSGPGGPIVTNPKQAKAIQISMARKEGHHIPPAPAKRKKSRRRDAFVGR